MLLLLLLKQVIQVFGHLVRSEDNESLLSQFITVGGAEITQEELVTLRKSHPGNAAEVAVSCHRDLVSQKPKYFDKKNVMYQQNYADYSPGFNWKRHLPWNFTDELRNRFVSKDFLKRRSESQNDRFAKSLRQLG